MSRPAVPGMMPSASLQIATLPLETLPMLQPAWHKPIARASSFLKLRRVGSKFCRSLLIDSRSKFVNLTNLTI